MPIRYHKLFALLKERGLRKKDLMQLADISPPTLSKLVKGETVQTDVLARICAALSVQPGDIMEHEKE